MKKIFLSLVIVFIELVSINAQNWKIVTIPADELKGIKEHNVYQYTDTKVIIRLSVMDENLKGGLLTKNKPVIQIYTKDEIINYKYNILIKQEYASGLIGFYDADNKMIKKISLGLFNMYDDLHIGAAYAEYKKCLEFLKSGSENHMRLVIPLYNEPDLDVIIPCFDF